ncbi:MAG: hypothetical protein HYU69_05155 [Bacteroidetes bacterium]|nr:hypothetical protein [Bacteroidota bacterium]
MQYLLCLAYIAFFIFLIQQIGFFEVPGLSRKALSGIFLFKILAGITLWAIYAYKYNDRSTSDIFKYFDDSKVMYDALLTSPADYFKMLAGIGNDTPHFARYYDQMNNWYNHFNSNLYNDSHSMIRLNAFMRLFSMGYYHVHIVFICFLSMTGLTGIYHFFADKLNDKKKLLTACIFLVPSVLLWSSGMVKEALIIFFMGILLYAFKKLLNGQMQWLSLLIITLIIFLLFVTKFYVLVALTPALAAFAWAYKSSIRLIFMKYAAVISIYILLGQLVRIFIPAYDPIEVIRIKQKDFLHISTAGIYLKNDSITVFIHPSQKSILSTIDSTNYSIKTGSHFIYFKNNKDDTLRGISKSDTIQFAFLNEVLETGSRIYLPKITATPWSLLKATPVALHNALFRPVLLGKHWLINIASVENWFILCFISCCLLFSKPLKTINWNYVLMGCTFSLMMYLLIGWITPVLGAIVRYKTPALPFFLIAFLCVLDQAKLKLAFKGKIRTR